MANKKYTAEELKERIKEAKARYKKKHPEVNNNNQNGADGNQTVCLYNKRMIRKIMGKCEVCGYEDWRTTVGHHIIPVGEEGSSDNLTNLMCLCRMCHSMVHKMYRRDKDDYFDFMNYIVNKRNDEQKDMINWEDCGE